LDEAAALMERALAIQRRHFGDVHPRVASALNECGLIALRAARLEEAAGCFQRMVEIYREVYEDRHYCIPIALSNLAGVYQELRQDTRAESLFREAIRRYGDTLEPDHPLVRVAHVRLGDVLLVQDRVGEAETINLTAYGILSGQSSPPPRWFSLVCANLATIYEKWEQPEKAAEFRACSSSAEAEPGK